MESIDFTLKKRKISKEKKNKGQKIKRIKHI